MVYARPFLKLVAAALLAIGVAGPAVSETETKAVDVAPGERLDTLFADLKVANSEDSAQTIEQQIWAAWMDSGSATVDLLVTRAGEAMKAKDNGLAMQLLDSVVELKPDYAEGWNRRATLHYVMKNYGESLGDIQRTLALEPRHFGAMSGLGSIFRILGDDEAAFEIYSRALEVHPYLKGARSAVEDLKDSVEGRGI